MEKGLAVAGNAADKFTVVLEIAGLNATELSAYCRERGLFPEQVSCWRQAAQDANAKPVLTMAEQKELEKLRAQDQRGVPSQRYQIRNAPSATQSSRQGHLPAASSEVYQAARLANPTRWSGATRCWSQPAEAWINKPSEEHELALELPLVQAA